MFVPTTANEEIPRRGGKPVLIAIQLPPLSPERKAPPRAPSIESSTAPAKSSGPKAESALTDWPINPVLAAVQFSPWLVERKAPPDVPAKSFLPTAATVRTPRFGKPVLASAQVSPQSLDRMTPPLFALPIPELFVPAKMFAPITANEVTNLFSGSPMLTAVQFSP